MRRTGAGVVTGHLLRGEGVEITAHALDRLGDLLRGAARGALEEHVLKKMEDAVLALRLVPAADAEPKADRNALDVRHLRHGELGPLAESFLRENHA